jgi:anti-sigma regulatory factor (Ser/Thr protein kinase)
MAGWTVREAVTLAGRAERARLARAFVEEVLGPAHPCGDVAALLVGELFSNSLRHSGSGAPGETVTVAVKTVNDVIRVEVTDRSGPGVPEPRPAGSDAEDGRGLQLVDRLAARWAWRRRGGRTVTWFELQALSQPMRPFAVSGKTTGTRTLARSSARYSAPRVRLQSRDVRGCRPIVAKRLFRGGCLRMAAASGSSWVTSPACSCSCLCAGGPFTVPAHVSPELSSVQVKDPGPTGELRKFAQRGLEVRVESFVARAAEGDQVLLGCGAVHAPGNDVVHVKLKVDMVAGATTTHDAAVAIAFEYPHPEFSFRRAALCRAVG